MSENNYDSLRSGQVIETSLGRVGLLNRGTYDSLATYKAGDFCLYGISTWLCKVDGTTGISPVEGANWQYLAKGADESSLVVLDYDTATVGQVKTALDANKMPILMGDAKSALILSGKEDSGDGGSSYTYQFFSSDSNTSGSAISAKTISNYNENSLVMGGDATDATMDVVFNADSGTVTDTYGVSEDSPQSLPAKVTTKKMFNGIGNWIANKLVHTDAFQTVLKQFLVNNGATTSEGFALDARYGKTLQDSVNQLNSGAIDINVSGTTDEVGIVIAYNVPVPPWASTAYCISNISNNLQTPWSVTISNFNSNSISFRIRKMSDNTALMNTAVSFSALVIFD